MNDSASIDTPLLVISTNRDPVSPLQDLALLLGNAVDSDSIILDLEGHCPPRVVREPIIAGRVADRSRQ